MKKQKKHFPSALLEWYSTHHRPLPWKGEKNPYYIWLSEIILQQTRVEQGLPYFEKFKINYPEIKDLADAQEDEVMKMWEGLGYYSRARNLHAAAKYVAYELNGKFPETYDAIKKLKGVGPYTAAAIASFAYDLPHAVVDGNVYRVLSRYFGIDTPIDSTEGKKLFAKLAQELLEITLSPELKTQNSKLKTPSSFNQAMMDFGAKHCTPKLAKCKDCLLEPLCVAAQKDKVYELPVKAKKLKRRERFFNYFIFHDDGYIFIKKRIEKDVWQNLYDFPLIETDALIEHFNQFEKGKFQKKWMDKKQIKEVQFSSPMKHELTHQRIYVRFWTISVGADFKPEESWVRLQRKNLKEYAFPKVIDRYFKEKFVPLNLF